MGLSAKQQLFVESYLTCLNATQAALRAGYSRRSAASIGSENLIKPEIRAAVDARLREAALEADQVLALLTDQALGSLDDFIDSEGAIDLKKARRQGRMHLLKEYSSETTVISSAGSETVTTRLTIKLHDPQAAAVQLGRYHRLFTDNKAVSGDLRVNWIDALDEDDEIGIGADQLPDAD